MKAGREMDALMAEKVMERPCCIDHLGTFDPTTGICWICNAPGRRDYSSDIRAAWDAWEKMAAGAGRFVSLQNCCPSEGIAWCAIVSDETGVYEGQADTAPLAICLAALRACSVEVDE